MKQKLIIMVVIGLGLISYLFFPLFTSKRAEPEVPIQIDIEKKAVEPSKMYVDIKGAVLHPGVYEVEKTMTIQDVILKSGGLLETASTEYLNLSKKVKDEMVILLYTKEEIAKAKEGENNGKKVDATCMCPKIQNDTCITPDKKVTNEKNQSTSGHKEEKKEVSFPINLNTATLEELMEVPGIGKVKAEDIIRCREEKKFEAIEDLQNIKGIGKTTYEKIRTYFTL